MVGMTFGPTGVTIQVSVNMEWDTALITPHRALFCAHLARTPCNPSFSKWLFVLTLLGREMVGWVKTKHTTWKRVFETPTHNQIVRVNGWEPIQPSREMTLCVVVKKKKTSFPSYIGDRWEDWIMVKCTYGGVVLSVDLLNPNQQHESIGNYLFVYST